MEDRLGRLSPSDSSSAPVSMAAADAGCRDASTLTTTQKRTNPKTSTNRIVKRCRRADNQPLFTLWRQESLVSTVAFIIKAPFTGITQGAEACTPERTLCKPAVFVIVYVFTLSNEITLRFTVFCVERLTFPSFATSLNRHKARQQLTKHVAKHPNSEPAW